jgi:hypothetical protein
MCGIASKSTCVTAKTASAVSLTGNEELIVAANVAVATSVCPYVLDKHLASFSVVGFSARLAVPNSTSFEKNNQYSNSIRVPARGWSAFGG